MISLDISRLTAERIIQGKPVTIFSKAHLLLKITTKLIKYQNLLLCHYFTSMSSNIAGNSLAAVLSIFGTLPFLITAGLYL